MSPETGTGGLSKMLRKFKILVAVLTLAGVLLIVSVASAWTHLGGDPLIKGGIHSAKAAHALLNSKLGVTAMKSANMDAAEIKAAQKMPLTNCRLKYGDWFLAMTYGAKGTEFEGPVQFLDKSHPDMPAYCGTAVVRNKAGQIIRKLKIKIPAKCANFGLVSRVRLHPKLKHKAPAKKAKKKSPAKSCGSAKAGSCINNPQTTTQTCGNGQIMSTTGCVSIQTGPCSNVNIGDGNTTDQGGNCNVIINPPTTVVDVCPNIEGPQDKVPAGDTIDATGKCVPIPPAPPATYTATATATASASATATATVSCPGGSTTATATASATTSSSASATASGSSSTSQADADKKAHDAAQAAANANAQAQANASANATATASATAKCVPAPTPLSITLVNPPQHTYVGGTDQICATATAPAGHGLQVTFTSQTGTVSTTFRPDPSGASDKYCTTYTAMSNPGSDTITATVKDTNTDLKATTSSPSFPIVADQF